MPTSTRRETGPLLLCFCFAFVCLNCEKEECEDSENIREGTWCEGEQLMTCGLISRELWTEYKLKVVIDCAAHGLTCIDIERGPYSTSSELSACMVDKEPCPEHFETTVKMMCVDNIATYCDLGSEFPVVIIEIDLCDMWGENCHESDNGNAICE